MPPRHEGQAFPGIEARRTDATARTACRAMTREHAARYNGTTPPPAFPIILCAWCDVCSSNTGKWCDQCELNNETFLTMTGETFYGRPMCSKCSAHPRVACPTCKSTVNDLDLPWQPGQRPAAN